MHLLHELEVKTSKLKFDLKTTPRRTSTPSDRHAILRPWATPPTIGEPTLEEQIAAYQREFRDLDPQVEKIVSALSRLNRRMNVAYGRQTADLGISNAEWEVLKALVLSGAPYRLGPGDLAKRLGLTPAAMTHRIDRMVGEGLVTRERDETNRVRVIVELTDRGPREVARGHAARHGLRGGPAPGPHRRWSAWSSARS